MEVPKSQVFIRTLGTVFKISMYIEYDNLLFKHGVYDDICNGTVIINLVCHKNKK